MVVTEVFEILKSLHAEGITILLVEQNVRQTLNVADRAYVLENGHLALEGACSLLQESDHVKKAYSRCKQSSSFDGRWASLGRAPTKERAPVSV